MQREQLGERIKRLRRERDFGLRETAQKVGISAGYLSQIETGQVRSPPAPKVIEELARVLDDDFDELLLAAGRVPEDIEVRLFADPTLTTFLRTAGDEGYSGQALMELLANARKGGA